MRSLIPMDLLRRLTLLACAAATLAWGTAGAEERFITVASTTSTEQSGLFGHLLPRFTAKTGIAVRVVAVGTGQAIQIAERGDADVLFVHHTPSEEKFVADGFGVKRYPVMYNDFVIVGPKADPAAIRGGSDAVAAFAGIARAQAPFASRGDDSGTHKAELALWKAAAVDVKAASGQWYRETGSGMGPTLNTAAGLGAYALTDRGTWAAFKNRGELEVLLAGDPRLFNPYGIILVNPARHPHVKAADGQAFIDWVISPAGQQAIADYKVDGEPLFFPNYRP
ncbi:tungstate transport system substrate-binding protein [Plasticicumulans lactativorans]|uniref:Tungstate transport system substrate-binding protein n=2 Tax=Plasticicumulans lactativorans TaxID=1133106 RepID=A0A4R2KZ09_9GAMM|nr:tungstate transport system substrate-binding protein [Plasticicumulans lactativorans]